MKNNSKAENGALILCSAAASFTFCVYAPYHIYFPNAEEFTFTFYDFWWIPLLCFAAVFAALILTGMLFAGHRAVWCGFLFGITAAMLLQGSVLYQDQGTFNGLAYNWRDNLSHIAADAAVWLLLAGICVFCALRWKKQALKVFAAGSAVLLAFLVLTSGILISSSKKEYLQKGECFVSDKDILTASQEENVIIFVLDMFDSSYMDNMLATGSSTVDEFRDFTYYRNNSGCYGATNYALGSLLSGRLMLNQEASYRETLNANYETNIFFPALLENNWSVGIYTEGKFIPKKLAERTCNCLQEQAAIKDIPAFLTALYRLAACTYAPDAIRPFVWLSGNEFDGLYRLKEERYQGYSISNSRFYEKLNTEEFSLLEQPCFRMIHLYGAHYPYIMDEALNPVPPSYSDANAVKAAEGSLKIVLNYLEKLKENGCYDRSIIVIMGDHGYSVDGGLTNPLLMIKSAGEKKGFSVSNVPASQADLQKTLLTAMNMPAEEAPGEDIFALGQTRMSERMYYQMFDAAANGQSRLVEYTVEPEGNERKYYQLTDREILPDGEVRQHSAFCAFCRENGLAPLDLPNDMSVMH